MDSVIVFAIRNYAGLGGDIAWAGGFAPGAVDVRVWPGGELYQQVKTPVAERDVALVAGTGNEADTLEAFDLACALVAQGARSLTLVIPFFGYSTMEKAMRPGEAVTARSRALLWSGLPSPPGGNRILILEPHSAGLPYYFESRNAASSLDASALMFEMLDGFPPDGYLLCSPDIGRIKWAESLATVSGRKTAFVLKRRDRDKGVKAYGVTGEVKDARVILCDDMIRTGDTLIEAAEACLEAGAREVSAVAVHGAFVPGALQRLKDAGLFRTLKCTDSHPQARNHAPDWPQITSCKDLVARTLASL